jgi:hypothetical protein
MSDSHDSKAPVRHPREPELDWSMSRFASSVWTGDEKHRSSTRPNRFRAVDSWQTPVSRNVFYVRYTVRTNECWYWANKGIKYCSAPRSARLFLYRAVVPLPLQRLFRLRGCHLQPTIRCRPARPDRRSCSRTRSSIHQWASRLAVPRTSKEIMELCWEGIERGAAR